MSGRAQVGEVFGSNRSDGATSVTLSDNGLVFQSRRFRAACRDYRPRQEFRTPYTPEQNGIFEGFFRSLKEEAQQVTTDQRYFLRPDVEDGPAGRCDIGAYEDQ